MRFPEVHMFWTVLSSKKSSMMVRGQSMEGMNDLLMGWDLLVLEEREMKQNGQQLDLEFVCYASTGQLMTIRGQKSSTQKFCHSWSTVQKHTSWTWTCQVASAEEQWHMSWRRMLIGHTRLWSFSYRTALVALQQWAFWFSFHGCYQIGTFRAFLGNLAWL